MVKSLLSNSANSYASSLINKYLKSSTVCGFLLQLPIPLTLCGIHLQLQNPKHLNHNSQQTKCTDKIFVTRIYSRGIHVNLVSGVHLHFGTCLNTCLWSPGAYRHKNVRLSSAQFGLVMS